MKRFTTAEKLLLLAPLLVLAATFGAKEFSRRASGADEMEGVARNLAGPVALDCGRAPNFHGQDYDDQQARITANACAVAAFKAHRPFRLRCEEGQFNHSGVETHYAFVGTPDGTFYYLSCHHRPYDSKGFTPLEQRRCQFAVVKDVEGERLEALR